jgi:hypothetical protein
MPLLGTFYRIEVQVPAKHSISKMAYWEPVMDDKGYPHKTDDLDQARADYARCVANNQWPVRLVREERILVMITSALPPQEPN